MSSNHTVSTTTEVLTLSSSTLTPEPRDQRVVMMIYVLLFLVGSGGNAVVLISLSRSRRRNRVDVLMKHLAVADVFVTCGVIPLEVIWKYTNEWLAGNFICKLLQVLRAFGLYLSSNILVCISIDRFSAVLYPLRLTAARKRSRRMLLYAWMFALACSLPQSVVFKVLPHPNDAAFEQCVSFDAFQTSQQELMYNVFCQCAMYFLPLVVITVCYVCIFWEIHKNSREFDAKYTTVHNSVGHVKLRRSGHRLLERARRRTLRMTVTIVSVFALCWLPYATMAMWYLIDKSSASEVSPLIQDLLFAMAVSNSCMNPLVYGSYALNLRDTFKTIIRRFCCSPSDLDTVGTSSTKTTKKHNLDAPLVLTGAKPRRRLAVRFAETSLTVVGPADPQTSRGVA